MSKRQPSYVAKGSAALGEVSRFGRKASGLGALPRHWTPPFVAFEVGTAERLVDHQAVRKEVRAALRVLGRPKDGVIVRSSAVEEGLRKRGAFDSAWCTSKSEAVIEKMASIAAKAPAGVSETLGFVIQVWVHEEATGHLSNERRVSRDPRSWMWEIEKGLPEPPEPSRLRVDSETEDRPELDCEGLESLPEPLRAVAREMKFRDERAHMEWVWDGTRVWIVQRDLDRTPEGPPPGDQWDGSPEQSLDGPLRIFKFADEKDFGFPKAEHVKVFAEAGLEKGDVRILCGSHVMSRLAQGRISRRLERDCRDLIKGPVVVRTDLRAEGRDPEILSRRTDTCTSYAELTRFLTKTAGALINEGVKPNDIAFLVHRFLLAEAGAIAFAKPDSGTVLIDATWGLPDSLMYHPHDSYEVEEGAKSTRSYLRCKTEYIDVDGTGRWRSRSAGAPWDWKSTLSDETARALALQARLVAQKVEHNVEVMFFISRSEGNVKVLPWFYCEPRRSSKDVEEAQGYYAGERVEVTDWSDLDTLKTRLEAEEGPLRLAIRLLPSLELMRKRKFVRAVAEVAAERLVPIELEGSQLSHSYYLLQDTDAKVRCTNPWNRPERRQSFGKLVRDMVPVQIRGHGEEATVHSVSREDLGELIRAKVIEEAVEYYWSDDQSSMEELADLLELLRAAATVLQVDFSTIDKAAKAKRKKRGGFEKGVVLVETREAPESARLATEDEDDESLLDEPPARRPRPRRVYRLPERRLVLPIAPPSDWELDKSRTVALDAEEEAVITYGETTIQVQVRPRRQEPGRYQLSVFEDPLV